MSNETAIKQAVKSLQDYWNTYDSQPGYENFQLETLIHDALYGLGIAVDRNQFEFATGYDKFKAILCDYLDVEAKHKAELAAAVEQAKEETRVKLADDIIDMLNKEARDPAGKGVYRWHVPLTVAVDEIKAILNAGKTGEGE